MTTESTNYNGWTNRETWNTMLWLDNEQSYYNAYRNHRQQHGDFTAKTAQQFVEGHLMYAHTPDGLSLKPVNWQEIADAMNEE